MWGTNASPTKAVGNKPPKWGKTKGVPPMLTEAECKNATCPEGKKRIRLTDAGSLYLEVSPTSKRWFWKYRKGAVESRLAIGPYPAVSLAAARRARDQARLDRPKGIDPVEKRQAEKTKAPDSLTFQEVALKWFELQRPIWSDAHTIRSERNLKKDLFPWIGEKPIGTITTDDLLSAIRKVEDRGSVEAAKRVLGTAGQVWSYWVAGDLVQRRNITLGMYTQLKKRIKGHFPAITDPHRLGELLRSIQAYKGGVLVRVALQLAPMLYQRPGNLRAMEWTEVDLDGGLWTIPSDKMKRSKADKENGQPHVVPLPAQAVDLLRELYPLTGGGRYVFPGERSHDRPMSDNSVRSGLYSMGFGKEQSWHGFRATARTMLVDQLDADPLAIEANLAHAVKDANGRSYNRTHYLKQRFAQIQLWADYLDRLRDGGQIIALDAHRAA